MPDSNFEGFVKFIDWTGRKARLNFAFRLLPNFHEREIWWAGFGENVGHEMNGKNYLFERPVIVVKKFNADMLLAVPTTTKDKRGDWYFPYEFEGQTIRAVLSQVRTISRRRLLRKMGIMDSGKFRLLRQAFVALILTDPPARAGGSSEPIACAQDTM